MTLTVDEGQGYRVASKPATTGRTASARKARGGGLGTLLFYLSVVGVLVLGWQARDEKHLTAETGLGYALGIAGAVLMLLLMLYPLRKRLKLMRNWGRVAFWFRTHMIFGVLGPVLILFHSNFSLGSLNSNVALTVMLTVAVSGLIGRFLYARIHHGLYGRKASLQELCHDAEAQKRALGVGLSEIPTIEKLIADFEAEIATGERGLLRSAWLALAIRFRTRRAMSRFRRQVKAALRQEARRRGMKPRAFAGQVEVICSRVDLYFQALRRVAGFVFFDRLFGLWHVLHFPLFILLVCTAILHVVAVHLY